MSKHTAGPWEVWDNSEKTPETYRIVRNARNTEQRTGLAICGSKADANLIAAAPELLSELQYALSVLKSEGFGNEVINSIESIINKALGK